MLQELLLQKAMLPTLQNRETSQIPPKTRRGQTPLELKTSLLGISQREKNQLEKNQRVKENFHQDVIKDLEMKGISKKIFALLALAVGMTSCSDDRLFEEFQSFDQEAWKEQDTVSFVLNIDSKEAGRPLIGVRFNENYPFSNLYVRYLTKDSTGAILENKLLNVPVFDSKSGSPLGKGFGDTFTKYDTLPFSLEENVRQVELLQYMRKEEVPGVEAIGLKILKK